MNYRFSDKFLIALLITILGCTCDEYLGENEKYYLFSENQFLDIIDDNKLRIDKPGKEEFNFVISHLDIQKWSLYRDKNIIDSLYSKANGKEKLKDYFSLSDSLEFLEIKKIIEDKSEFFGLTTIMLSKIKKAFELEYARSKNDSLIDCQSKIEFYFSRLMLRSLFTNKILSFTRGHSTGKDYLYLPKIDFDDLMSLSSNDDSIRISIEIIPVWLEIDEIRVVINDDTIMLNDDLEYYYDSKMIKQKDSLNLELLILNPLTGEYYTSYKKYYLK